MVQARRQEGLQAACTREAARYEVRRADVQGCIHSAEQDIEVAKADLATAQVFREHQQEYEVSFPAAQSGCAGIGNRIFMLGAPGYIIFSVKAVAASQLWQCSALPLHMWVRQHSVVEGGTSPEMTTSGTVGCWS